MNDRLQQYISQLEALAKESGLDYYPVDFQVVPPAFMMEVAVYGLPVRMPHWSFGVRYIYQLVQHRMGGSRIFEVVYPGNPGRAYLADTNTVEENTLVAAHVLGHADFAKNNFLFKRSQEQVGYHIVEQAAAHAQQIAAAIAANGQERVEAILDAALALEQHIDLDKGLRRPRYPTHAEPAPPESSDPFQTRYEALTDATAKAAPVARQRAPLPPHPEQDLLWFIANYAPELEDWERDIFLMVREESFYFYPVFACQIMNEGWASYWHARLLREADFLPHDLYVQAVKTHSDVVRPYGAGQQVALSINPYHLGFFLWEHIVETQGLPAARRIMEEDDDFSFIRNQLTEELAKQLNLFVYEARRDGRIVVDAFELDAVHEQVLAGKFNFGAPRVAVEQVAGDGGLRLRHLHNVDGRGLDLHSARKVLDYIHRAWRRPVTLVTVNAEGREEQLAAGKP
jgi:stage V sporulation protein R